MRLCYINYSLLYNKLFPNLSKQQICIISVWGQEFEHSLAECLCFKVCHQTTLKVVARDGVSSEGSTRGSFASKLTKWLLAGFRCSQAIGLRASASHWLLACALLQSLAMRATAQTSSQPGILASLRASESERGCARRKPQPFCVLDSELISHCFCFTQGRSKSPGLATLKRRD